METVTEATRSHVRGIRRVCAAGWQAAYDDVLPGSYVEANVDTFYDADRLRREIRESESRDAWLVALDGERVVGAARDARPEPSIGEVFVLYVHPDRRGEGIGSTLLESVTDRQRAAGATEQRVSAFADNDAARAFYERKGFEEYDRHPAATVGGVDPECEAVELSRRI